MDWNDTPVESYEYDQNGNRTAGQSHATDRLMARIKADGRSADLLEAWVRFHS